MTIKNPKTVIKIKYKSYETIEFISRYTAEEFYEDEEYKVIWQLENHKYGKNIVIEPDSNMESHDLWTILRYFLRNGYHIDVDYFKPGPNDNIFDDDDWLIMLVRNDDH